MAAALPTSFFFLLTISALLSSGPRHAAAAPDDFLVQLNHKPAKQKLSRFRLYWHDIVAGGAPTSVPVVKHGKNNEFGQVNMIDNPLTLGPELSSRVVGRAQGFYAVASQEEKMGLLMAMNFVITDGKYNGSTITILGRNAVFNHVREMPVIGGSGLFRFASGYAQVRTHVFDLKSGDATVEYSIYVLHY